MQRLSQNCIRSVPQGTNDDCEENQCLFRDTKLKVKCERGEEGGGGGAVAQPEELSETLNKLSCTILHSIS